MILWWTPDGKVKDRAIVKEKEKTAKGNIDKSQKERRKKRMAGREGRRES